MSHTRKSLLIVDDEANIREGLREVFKDLYEPQVAASAKSALELFQQYRQDVVLTDLKLKGPLNGLDLLEQIKAIDRSVQVIVFTAYGTIEGAVEAMKKGAYDYIPKPFDIKHMRHIVANAMEHRHLWQENQRLKRQLVETYQFEGLIGSSPAMREVYRIIEQGAPTDATVLIYGESGTGKELVARAIHSYSRRKDKPFICLNCGAIPASLFPSELFGHERGSFTGAFTEKKGVFEEADSGTLFLDEVSEIPLEHQATFLRVLQEREFKRIGATRPQQVDVRILASTNHNLEERVREKQFRADLYYRLNVIRINLPPLRERPGDIELLIQHFLAQEAQRQNQPPKTLSPEALEWLEKYPWPGNVRQLKNIIQRAFILAPDTEITIKELPDEDPCEFIANFPTGLSLKSNLQRAEKEALIRALRQANSNRRRAAQLLGISLRKLQYMIKTHNLKGI